MHPDFAAILKHSSRASSALLLYPGDVLLANRIPGRHVLLHALRKALLLAAGEGSSGLGDALFKAVLVEFLARLVSARDRNWQT